MEKNLFNENLFKISLSLLCISFLLIQGGKKDDVNQVSLNDTNLKVRKSGYS